MLLGITIYLLSLVPAPYNGIFLVLIYAIFSGCLFLVIRQASLFFRKERKKQGRLENEE